MDEASMVSIESLQGMIRDEVSFTKFFKKSVFDVHLGKGSWVYDGRRGFKLTLLDGSYLKIRFFNTVKRILSSKSVEIVGRESLLSYVDVSVMPSGMKGYSFILDDNQFAVAKASTSNNVKAKHAACLKVLTEKAGLLEIDLTSQDVWETYYVGKM